MKGPDTLPGQKCPICNKNTLTLIEDQREIPFFGKVFIFSMVCDSCKYHKADIEAEEKKDPCKYVFEVENEEDLKVRVVKSSGATIKIPHITTISPGTAANGYITNIEGLIQRAKKIIENIRDNDDEPDARKKAKNMLKKIQRILWGKEKIKISIEDPSGNSAIISEKAVKTKIKK